MPEPMNTQDLGPVPEFFDTQKSYQVQLKEAFVWAGVTFSPANICTFQGDFAEFHRNKISSAREV